MDALIVLLATWMIADVCYVWSLRLNYPYDLEWMEGGMLGNAWRLTQGLSLYEAPTLEFVPYIYPPGYPSVVGLFGGVFGITPGLGRAVSIFGTLMAGVGIVYASIRHGGTLAIGLGAAACFMGCYTRSGAFYDLARPDGLLVGLLIWSLVIAGDRRRGSDVLSGLLLCSAFLLKHNAAALGVPLVLSFWLRGGTASAGRFVLASAAPALACTAALQWVTGGHFLTYLLVVPGSHPIVGSRVMPGVPVELARALPVAYAVLCFVALRCAPARVRGVPSWAWMGVCVLFGSGFGLWVRYWPPAKGVQMPSEGAVVLSVACVVAALAMVALRGALWPRQRSADADVVLFGGAGLVLLVLTALMRGHHGGFLNVYIPMHAAMALGFGVVLARAVVRYGRGAEAIALVLVGGQLVWHMSERDLERLIPTQADRAAGDRVVEALSVCTGPVWSPYAVWLPTYAGFEPGSHLIALWDINHKEGPYVSDMAAIRQGIADQAYGCILDGARDRLRYGVQDHYGTYESFGHAGSALRPKTGWPVRPGFLLAPSE